MKKIKRICSLIFGFILAIPMKIWAVAYTPSSYAVSTAYGVGSPDKLTILIKISQIFRIVIIPLMLFEGYIIYRNRNEEDIEVKEKISRKKVNICILLLIFIFTLVLSCYPIQEEFRTGLESILVLLTYMILIIPIYKIYFHKNRTEGKFFKIMNVLAAVIECILIIIFISIFLPIII